MRSGLTACASSQNATQSWETIGSLIALDRVRERGDQLVGADADLAVVGVERLRHGVGELELVALAVADVGEADRERRQPALALLGQQRDDQARVDPARQQDADRHVGDHPPPHGDAQRLQQRLAPLLRRPAASSARVCGGSQ